MIASDRQYHDTLEAIARFEHALALVDEATADLHPLARQTMAEAYADQLELLRAEVAEYEAGRAPADIAQASG